MTTRRDLRLTNSNAVVEAPPGRGFGFEARPASDEWYTPRWVFDAMGLQFDLDPCAAVGTPAGGAGSRCATRVVPPEDGLAKAWEGPRQAPTRSVWLNPPYSDVGAWVTKWLTSRCTGVVLVYARTDTTWAQHLLANAEVVLFLRKRVRFEPGAGQAVSSPGAPSMLVGRGAAESDALARMARVGHGVLLRGGVAW